MKIAMKVLLGSAVILGPALAAGASTVINQMPTDQSNGVPSVRLTGPTALRAADDFRFPTGNGQGYTVTSLSGHMFSSLGIVESMYRLEIYGSSGNAPGSLVYSGTPFRVEDWGPAPGGMRLVQPMFAPNVVLSAGTTYWVSLVGLASDTGWATFATSHYAGTASGGLAMSRAGTGAWQAASVTTDLNIRDLAFQIEGVQAVPAPAAAGVLVLAGVVGSRRRRG